MARRCQGDFTVVPVVGADITDLCVIRSSARPLSHVTVSIFWFHVDREGEKLW